MPKKIEVVYLPIDAVKPNEWNPNVEDDKKFNLLVESIRQIGMVQPIQVVDNEDGTYTIIAGEHRWKACKVLGYETIPAIVHSKDEWDEDLQKFLTVRFNVISGKLDPIKLADLVAELEEKYDKDVIKEMMGFTEEQIAKKLFDEIVETLPDDIKEKLEETRDEIKTVEGLSQVVNRILAEYGEKVPTNFIFFVLGGKEHVMISATPKLYKKVKQILKDADEHNIDVNEVLYEALKNVNING